MSFPGRDLLVSWVGCGHNYMQQSHITANKSEALNNLCVHFSHSVKMREQHKRYRHWKHYKNISNGFHFPFAGIIVCCVSSEDAPNCPDFSRPRSRTLASRGLLQCPNPPGTSMTETALSMATDLPLKTVSYLWR